MKFTEELQIEIDSQWKKIKQGKFYNQIMNHTVTKELYGDLLIQIYHYTSHNARNQAVAAKIDAPSEVHKFCYTHAEEEHGHEKMASHDLERIGMLANGALTRPRKPATAALIKYLYAVADTQGPIARLGYSFWAENVYDQIGDMLKKVRSDLNLTDKDMTFFVAHAEIDKRHGAEVIKLIDKHVITDVQKGMVKEVALASLALTSGMLDSLVN